MGHDRCLAYDHHHGVAAVMVVATIGGKAGDRQWERNNSLGPDTWDIREKLRRVAVGNTRVDEALVAQDFPSWLEIVELVTSCNGEWRLLSQPLGRAHCAEQMEHFVAKVEAMLRLASVATKPVRGACLSENW